MARMKIPTRGKSRYAAPEEPKIEKKMGRPRGVPKSKEQFATPEVKAQVQEVKRELSKINFRDMEELQKEYDALRQNIVEILGVEAYRAACQNIKRAILDGDLELSRFLLENIIVKPRPKTQMNYKVDKLDSVNDIQEAHAKLIRDIGDGALSMEEGEYMETRFVKLRESVFQSKVETAVMGVKMAAKQQTQTTSLMNLFN